MALYDDLTDEEKSNLAIHERYMRDNSKNLCRMTAELDTEQWDEFIRQTIDPILDSLNNNETIPNTSGLQGSKDFKVLEYKNLKQGLNDLHEQQQLLIELLVKACGVGIS